MNMLPALIKKRLVCIVLLTAILQAAYCQLEASLPDSALARIYNDSAELSTSSLNKCLAFGSLALKAATKANDKTQAAAALVNIGYGYECASNYEKAIYFYTKALAVNKSNSDLAGMAACCNYIGLVYKLSDNYDEALENFYKSVEIYKIKGDDTGEAFVLNNIGLIYHKLSEYDKALEAYEKSAAIFTKIGDYINIGAPVSNIGMLYYDKKDYEDALKYYEEALEISEKCDDNTALAIAYNNMGTVYFKTGKFEKALENYLKSLSIKEENNLTSGIPTTLNNIGNVYMKQGELQKAGMYYLECMEKAEKLNLRSVMRDNFLDLSELYEKLEVPESAFRFYKLYATMKDSIMDEESSKKIAESQVKYEVKDKERENSNLRQQNDIQELQISRGRNIRNLIIVIFVLIGIVVAFIFYSLIQKQKLKQLQLYSKAETAILESEKKYKDLANLLPQIVFEIDDLGFFTFVNTNGLNYTGYSMDDIKNGMHLSSLFDEKDKARITCIIDNIFAGINTNPGSEEYLIKRKDGSVFPGLTYCSYITYKENIIGLRGIIIDISERREFERKILNKIIETEEKERKRFAEDLHDGLGPLLSSIMLYINESMTDDMDPEERTFLLKHAADMTNEAVTSTRSIANNLMPSIITDFGLVKAVESFCSKLRNTKTISVDFTANDASPLPDKTIEIILYRIALELTNNTIKHAEAGSIQIHLQRNANSIIMNYEDDGKGFHLEKVLADPDKGLGLNNIINRTRSVNGTCEFVSAPGKGFKATIKIFMA
jgi:PAS domain S-box-containing protein